MKKWFKRFVCGVCSILALFSMSMPMVSQAKETLTESSPYTQKLYLYMLVDSNINYWSFKTYYNLTYKRSVSEIELYPNMNNRGFDFYTIDIYCPDYRIVGTLDEYPDYKIYEIIKPIPEGKLCLAPVNYPSGEANYTMTRDYKAPYEGWGHYLQGDYVDENDEYFQVEIGDIVTAYAIYGSDDLLYDNSLWDAYAEWAEENDASLYGEIAVLLHDTDPEDESYTYEEAQEIINDAANNTVVEAPTPVIEDIDDVPSRTTTTTTTTIIEPEPEEVSKGISPALMAVLAGGGIIAILGILLFIKKKVRG